MFQLNASNKFSTDIYFGNLTQIKITHSAFKKGFRIHCVNGTLFIYRYASSHRLDFQWKTSQTKLFQSSFGKMGKLLGKVGCLPLPLLQLKEKKSILQMFLTLIYRQKPQYGHTAPPLLELLLIPLGGVSSFLPNPT